MISRVIKYDGSIEDFDATKLLRWAEYACKYGGDWNDIARQVYRMLPEVASSKDIQEAMIRVCSDKGDLAHSRIAARLELAVLRKNAERVVGVSYDAPFTDIFKAFTDKGVWDKSVMPEVNEEWNEWYKEGLKSRKEHWELVQWGDKYSAHKDGEPFEVPHAAMLASALALHSGDTEQAKKMYLHGIKGDLMSPTPALNGLRNGDFNTISCSLVHGGDTTDSIEVANHLAMMMTARKAGIGITHDVRSKGDPVRGGVIEHLGKWSIYADVSSSVKVMLQQTRGGSATIAFKAIDPEVESIIFWKSQRTAIDTRLDKVDYNFVYNDSFVDAVVNNEDWYLFSLYHHPEVYEAFTESKEVFNEAVDKAKASGKPFSKMKARDLLADFLTVRNETGRMYCLNITRANTHTPFIDKISQSNLCMEILQPTHPYKDMKDLVVGDDNGISEGEISFCGLSGVNYSKIAEEDVESVVASGVRVVTEMIKKTPPLYPTMKHKMLKRMNVGLGINGLAEYMYRNGFDYDGSKESLQFVKDVAERHMFIAYKTSIDMVGEGHPAVEGVDFNWLPIDTMVDILGSGYKQDWESIRGKPRSHSVLVSVQPMESSSVYFGGSNSVYPVRAGKIGKGSRKGIVQQHFLEWDKDKHLSAWDIDSNTLSSYYSVIQDFTDQAISADYYFNPNKWENKRKPMSVAMREWVEADRKGVKTAYYLNTYIDNSDSQINLDEDDGCVDCKM